MSYTPLSPCTCFLEFPFLVSPLTPAYLHHIRRDCPRRGPLREACRREERTPLQRAHQPAAQCGPDAHRRRSGGDNRRQEGPEEGKERRNNRRGTRTWSACEASNLLRENLVLALSVWFYHSLPFSSRWPHHVSSQSYARSPSTFLYTALHGLSLLFLFWFFQSIFPCLSAPVALTTEVMPMVGPSLDATPRAGISASKAVLSKMLDIAKRSTVRGRNHRSSFLAGSRSSVSSVPYRADDPVRKVGPVWVPKEWSSSKW